MQIARILKIYILNTIELYFQLLWLCGNSWTRAQDALHFDAGVEVIVMEFRIVKRFILAFFSTLDTFQSQNQQKSLMSAMLMKFPVFATWPA